MIDTPAPPAEVPQSAALSEASTDSLSELFSRDPEHLSELDLTKVVEGLRAQRVKWAAAEASAPEKKKTAVKLSSVSQAKPGDLDL